MDKKQSEGIITTFILLQKFVVDNLDCKNKPLLLQNLMKLKEEYFKFFEYYENLNPCKEIKINITRIHKFFQEKLFEKLNCFLIQHNNKKLNKKQIFKVHLNFLIFIAKATVLLKLFKNASILSKNDLFSQPFDSEDWKLIFQHTKEIVIQKAFIN